MTGTNSFRRLLRDERGWVYTHIAVLIIAPILLIVMGTAAITALRTGASLTEAMDRAVLAQTMLDDFENAVSSAATITWSDDEVTTVIDPAAVPATSLSNPADILPECVTVIWTVADDGSLASLTRTVQRHQAASCASPVAATIQSALTGLQLGAGFTMHNAHGRELTDVPGFEFGHWVPASQPKPAGLTDGQWGDTRVATVRFDAVMQELIGARDLRATARTPVPAR